MWFNITKNTKLWLCFLCMSNHDIVASLLIQLPKVIKWHNFILSNTISSCFFLSDQQGNIAMNGQTIDFSDSGSGHENGNGDFKILGATEVNSELHFMYTSKDQNMPQMISNKDVKIKYPQELMAFYESCMVNLKIVIFLLFLTFFNAKKKNHENKFSSATFFFFH